METNKQRNRFHIPGLSMENKPWMSAIIPIIVFSILLTCLSPNFLTASNISNILRQVTVYAILAVGMTFVIITSGIDLSVGSVIPVVCIVVATILNKNPGSIWLAIFAGLLVGVLVGFLNGILVAQIGIPPFIMTMGTMKVMSGFALLVTNSSAVKVADANYRFIGTGSLLGIPVPIYLFIIVALIAHIILTQTPTGRHVFALGSNVEAARLSGVKVKKTLVAVYMFSGLCAAIAAIVYLARLGSCQAIAGDGYEMEAIAATVIGGTSITGGSGGVIGSILGAILMGIIKNGLVLLGVSTYWQQIVTGFVVIIAIIMDLTRKQVISKRDS